MGMIGHGHLSLDDGTPALPVKPYNEFFVEIMDVYSQAALVIGHEAAD